MKLSGIFFMVLAMLALFVSGSEAAPKFNLKGITKGAKAIGKGISFVGAAGKAHGRRTKFNLNGIIKGAKVIGKGISILGVAGTAHEMWKQRRQG